MKAKDKIESIKYSQRWNDLRKEVKERLSQQQDIFCCCGKLATGLHEMSCKKFRNLVDKETLKEYDLQTWENTLANPDTK